MSTMYVATRSKEGCKVIRVDEGGTRRLFRCDSISGMIRRPSLNGTMVAAELLSGR
jgi:hypothetical protein